MAAGSIATTVCYCIVSVSLAQGPIIEPHSNRLCFGSKKFKKKKRKNENGNEECMRICVCTDELRVVFFAVFISLMLLALFGRPVLER